MQLAWKATELYMRHLLEDIHKRTTEPASEHEVPLTTQGARHLAATAAILSQQSLGDVDGAPGGDTTPEGMMEKLKKVMAAHDGKPAATTDSDA